MKSDNMTKLIVMIPALNEEESIATVIKAIQKIRIKGINKIQILVMDDGSTDNTAKIAKKLGAVVSSSKINQGLGITFKNGIEKALELGADIIAQIDADNQFDANDIPRLVQPIIEGKAGMVSCSRFKDKNLVPKMPGIKKFGNNIFTFIISKLTGQKFTDTQCGFRAYSKEACLRLNLQGKFTYTQEVFLDLAFKNVPIQEVACKVRGEREFGKSKIVKSWYSYGTKALMIILRSLRDYKPLLFFGLIGSFFFGIGAIMLLWLFVRWLLIHQTSPFTSLISASALLIIIGFILFVLALIADMLGRQKKTQEEILYQLKLKKYADNK